MASRVELHFHLLPGVDDGPRDLAETLELARMAVADGTRTITATPHVRDATLSEIPGRLAEVRAAIAAQRVPLEVLPGAEVAFDDVAALTREELEGVAQGPAQARWVLLEAPLWSDDLDAFTASIGEVRDQGFGVLVGHPERCPALRDSPSTLATLERAGCPLQVNATSLLGRHGDEARDHALGLVRDGRAHVIASDAHRPERGPALGAALGALAAHGLTGPAVERLVADHPAALLRDGLPAAALQHAAA